MKNLIKQSTGIDVLAFLSLCLFLITSDHIIAPLFLLFFLSVWYETTFIGVTFGLAMITFIISSLIRNRRFKVYFFLVHLMVSLTCVVGIFCANPKMFYALPSLVSLIVYLIFSILSFAKWILHLVELRKLKPSV
jgi:hypothetical protein